ncbi:MAG TPA: DivIVA domain-containing protein, partial [Solirubrobacteraceae bacterium]|nr:DivIVA domain-containing protein [Solirubrobacteraceae bacterium]
MALDRQSIEKRDFPINRRGYDPEAVDAHLARIAEEVEELKLSARRRSETLASTASEQVRAIVEAAEASAAQIQSQAEAEAHEIRTEAAAEAESARSEANSQARSYVSRVSESTAVMLQRLDAMQSELGTLINALRTGGNRLNADLQLLDGNFDEVRDAVGSRGRLEAESEPAEEELFERAAEPEPVAPVEPEGAPAERLTEASAEPAGETGGGLDGDIEGARLIALNMAMNRTPREETDRYLAENFQLSDRAGLLDEVYSSVGD